jgi:hypothetical integral membrane protein (TIGR02206 family)
MGNLIAWDFVGEPFILFGTGHLIAIGLVALATILLVVLGRRSSEKTRKTIRYTLAAILVVDELAWHAWNIYVGQWSIQNTLPFHLCSVLVWLSAYMLITKNYTIYEFAYLLGIAGALQALLTPDAGKFGFPHFRAFQTMISHGTIIASAVYMTLVENYRPTWASVKRVLIGANIYMVVIFVLNFILQSNYLFIRQKPATASLLDALPAWPYYIIFIELIGVAFALLLYSPYAVSDWIKKRSANKIAQ